MLDVYLVANYQNETWCEDVHHKLDIRNIYASISVLTLVIELSPLVYREIFVFAELTYLFYFPYYRDKTFNVLISTELSEAIQ